VRQRVELVAPQAAVRPLLPELHGTVTDTHRFELQLHLDLMAQLDRAIAEVEERLPRALAPFRRVVERLPTIPGISTTTAHILLAEAGRDRTRLATAGHWVSWAGRCPRLDERAGQRRSVRVRTGGRWLKTALVPAAGAAINVHPSSLQAQSLRLTGRRGPTRALIAAAASMLAAAYHMLRTETDSRDLGGAYFDRRDQRRVARRLGRRLNHRGDAVDLPSVA
jgi:transposase